MGWELTLRAGGWLRAEGEGLGAEVEGGHLPLRDSRRRRDLIRFRRAQRRAPQISRGERIWHGPRELGPLPDLAGLKFRVGI